MNGQKDDQPLLMTIAGSDCSGGAGIQADLKTFAALGCYGTSAITALTAQNTQGVRDVHPSPPDFVEHQITAILDDMPIQGIKTGMLFDSNVILAVVRSLKSHFSDGEQPPLVCDPVCVSTSGHSLLQPDAIETLMSELFPLATLITPNKSEAELLLSHRSGTKQGLNTIQDVIAAAQLLSKSGCDAVLVKGGHLTLNLDDLDRLIASQPRIKVVGEARALHHTEVSQANKPHLAGDQIIMDILYESRSDVVTVFTRQRVNSTSTHGTGCTLSAALASELARGVNLCGAVQNATSYTHLGIETARSIGRGNGPLNHLHALQKSCIPRQTPSNPFPLTSLLIQSSYGTWKEYVEHPFVVQLGKGTLSKERFVHFIRQDYHYLRYYARAYSLLAAKSSSFSAISQATDTVLNVLTEIGTHRTFCAQFDVTEDELKSTKESAATTAYGCFILDVGMKGDTASLLMALLACLLGYGEVGLWLKRHASGPNAWVKLEDSNPYARWIEDYSGDMYQKAVTAGLETVETLAVNELPSSNRFEEWKHIWNRCTQLEKEFWDMAMDLS